MSQTCSQCQLAFRSTVELFAHVRTNHCHLQDFECTSSNCHRRFQLFSSFKVHYRKDHLLRHDEETVNNSVFNSSNNDNLANSTDNNYFDSCETINLENPDDNSDSNVIERCDLSESIDDSISCSGSEASEDFQDFPDDDFNLENFCQSMVSTHFQQLYSKRSFTRKDIQSVTDNTVKLLTNVSYMLEKLVIPTEETSESFQKIVHFLNNPFKNNLTEYHRKKNLQSLGFLIWPKKVFLDQRLDERMTGNGLQMKPTTVTFTMIPLRKLFVAIFECDGVYEMAESFLNSTEHLETGIIDDVCHSPFWSEVLKEFPDKFVVPFIFFYDECEMNNGMGSHAGVHKIGFGYVSLRCFPLEYQSRLCNIFSALLVHHGDKRDNSVFEAFIDEIIFLEKNGITVKLQDGSEKQIYFVMVSVAGDNAGLDEVLGFVNSSGN